MSSAPSSVPPRPSPGARRRLRSAEEIRQYRRHLATYALLAVAVLLMVHAVVGENGYLAGLRAQREYDSVMAQLVKLRLDNQQLKEQARRLKEDPTAIEDAARRDLGLVRPGETLVIVKDVGSAADRH
jgi:cell division protein FtsB